MKNCKRIITLLGVCYFLSLGSAISNADDGVENKTIENKELLIKEGSANLSSGSIDFINSNKITHREEYTAKFKDEDFVELSFVEINLYLSLQMKVYQRTIL